MAWIAGLPITGSSGTLPAHQAGDLIVITAVKWGTSGSNPTVPSGWTSSSSGTNIYRRSGATGSRPRRAPPRARGLALRRCTSRSGGT